MDGDVAPLGELAELARRHGCRLMVDEAHGTGALGPGGRGAVAAAGLSGEVDVIVGTLGKALGSYGAYVCASRRDHRAAGQHRPPVHLLHRAAAARRSAPRGPPWRSCAVPAGPGRAAPAQRGRPARGARRPRARPRRVADPCGAGARRRRPPGDGAVRAVAGERRLRPGDPPTDGSCRYLAAAPRGDGKPRRRGAAPGGPGDRAAPHASSASPAARRTRDDGGARPAARCLPALTEWRFDAAAGRPHRDRPRPVALDGAPPRMGAGGRAREPGRLAAARSAASPTPLRRRWC